VINACCQKAESLKERETQEIQGLVGLLNLDFWVWVFLWLLLWHKS